ncbi:unnamed protein product [Angiostrongylus costaricensis]|uniref:COesterase domain-containing protein n=1 Tax=Angiostrongylus costaricensis TaxID=334426 RepID=A0A0R3PX32_ANGCS|nr:unnamed protein product [Angiostrongylus costaricensis]
MLFISFVLSPLNQFGGRINGDPRDAHMAGYLNKNLRIVGVVPTLTTDEFFHLPTSLGNWQLPQFCFLVYGITKGFRPPTALPTPYLVSPYKKFTLDKVYGINFSFWTYSYMPFFVPFASLAAQSFASAAEVACYSYLYAIVNERSYRRVASYDRSADLTRKLLASTISPTNFVPSTTVAYLAGTRLSRWFFKLEIIVLVNKKTTHGDFTISEEDSEIAVAPAVDSVINAI